MQVLVRINFLSTKPDSYNLIAVPYDGCAALILARDVPREAAIEALKRINVILNRLTTEHGSSDFDID